MTAYRFVTITCNGCGQIWENEMTNSIREARRWARRIGWRTAMVDGYLEDYCGRECAGLPPLNGKLA